MHPIQHSTVTQRRRPAPWAAAPARDDLTQRSPQSQQLTQLLTTAAEKLQSLGLQARRGKEHS